MRGCFQSASEEADSNRTFHVRFLRKEVIQPHLPVRLPCYDFIPITSHSIGTSIPCGLT